MKKIIYAIILAVLGLAVGYFLFGEILGNRIPIENIFFGNSDNLISAFVDEMVIKPIRLKILISTIFGGVLGFIIGFISDLKNNSLRNKNNEFSISKNTNLKETASETIVNKNNIIEVSEKKSEPNIISVEKLEKQEVVELSNAIIIEHIETSKNNKFKIIKKLKVTKFLVFFVIGIVLIISILFLFNQWNSTDFSNPKEVVNNYSKIKRKGDVKSLYDDFLSQETKNNITKDEFIKASSIDDSILSQVIRGDIQFFDIEVNNSTYKRFKSIEENLYKGNKYKNLSYYTLKNENGKWKVTSNGALLKIAMDHISSGNYTEALKVLNKCIEINPFNGDIYEQIGWCFKGNTTLSNEQRVKEILKNATLAITFEEEDPHHYLLLSQYYNDIDDLNLSIEYLKRGINYCLNEDEKTLYNQNIAKQYLVLQDYANAEIYINKSISISDKDPITWYILGKIQQTKQDYKKALVSYEKALQAVSNSNIQRVHKADLYANYANLSNSFNHCDSAKKYILKALDITPDDQYFKDVYKAIKEKCN